MRHRSRAAISTTATVTALIAALVATPPAHADRYTQDDPAGDMSRQDGGSGAISPAPGHAAIDIRHVIVRHTDHFVSIRAVFDRLNRPRGAEGFGMSGFVKPNRRARPWESTAWTWEVGFDKTKPRVGDRMFVMDSTHQEMFGCAGYSDHGLKARANYHRDRVTVIIPRRCLTMDDRPNIRPRWVQVLGVRQSRPERQGLLLRPIQRPDTVVGLLLPGGLPVHPAALPRLATATRLACVFRLRRRRPLALPARESPPRTVTPLPTDTARHLRAAS